MLGIDHLEIGEGSEILFCNFHFDEKNERNFTILITFVRTKI